MVITATLVRFEDEKAVLLPEDGNIEIFVSADIIKGHYSEGDTILVKID